MWFLVNTFVHYISKHVWRSYIGIYWSAGNWSISYTNSSFLSKYCFLIYLISFFIDFRTNSYPNCLNKSSVWLNFYCCLNDFFILLLPSLESLFPFLLNFINTAYTISASVKQSSPRYFLSLSISTTKLDKHSIYSLLFYCYTYIYFDNNSLFKYIVLFRIGRTSLHIIRLLKKRSWFFTIVD